MISRFEQAIDDAGSSGGNLTRVVGLLPRTGHSSAGRHDAISTFPIALPDEGADLLEGVHHSNLESVQR